MTDEDLENQEREVATRALNPVDQEDLHFTENLKLTSNECAKLKIWT